MLYVTAIRMGRGGREEHIERCLVLDGDSGKTAEGTSQALATAILNHGWTYKVGSPAGPVEVDGVRAGGRPHHVRTVRNGLRSDNLVNLPTF